MLHHKPMKSIPITFSGKVAVVTGGASGIGEAMVKTFARAGATSVIADLHEQNGARVAKQCAARGDKAWFWKTDVTREDSVAALFAEVKKRSKRLDVLVCNAAWMNPQMYKPFVVQPLAEWDKTLDINFRGTMLCCKAALPMLQKSKGNIIGISSVGATGVFLHAAAYCASKAALQHMIKAIALEYASKGVRANLLAPGWIDTPGASFATADKKLVRAQLDKMVPIRRLGTTQEIANVALFLASDLASFVTGSVYGADGGWLLE